MKKSLQCPKCESRKLWHVQHAATPAMQSGKPGPARVSVAVVGSMWRGLKGLGGYETFTCAACGYTEWYAYGLDELKVDEKAGVSFIDTTPEAGLR